MIKKKNDKKDQMNSEARRAFSAWINGGRKSDNEGYPVLNKKDAYAILRVLLPRLDVKKEFSLGSFKTTKDCIKWLGDVKRGTSWDEEMIAWETELTAMDENEVILPTGSLIGE